MTTLASAPLRAACPSPPAVLDDPIEQQRFTRTAGALAESSFQIGGIHCAACAGTIEQALHGVDGVEDARVQAASARALVRWDPQRTRPSALVEAIRRAGYDAMPDTAAGARALRTAEGRRLLWRLFVAGFCAMQVMMLATPSYVAGPGELAPDLRELLNRAQWLLTLPVLFFSAAPFFRGAAQALKQRRIGMDVPVALGIAVCFVASSGAAFDPQGPFGHEVYFDSLTMFISFLLLGRFLEMKARHRSAESLERTLAAMPQTARRVAGDGTVETVSVHRVNPGDLLLVSAGESFAADGVIVEGQTDADESLLTGESHPVPKAIGDAVVAGSVNQGQPVRVRVECVGADTRYEGIVALMREAMSQRPAAALTADRWAGPFLWAVLLLAGAGAVAWHFIDPSRAVWVAVSVLIVTCPCALSLATPAALLTAAASLARRGVLLRRIEALEALARVDTVFLDKTGTLTDARPAWRNAHALTDNARQHQPELLRAAAALAAQSRHPLSQALAAAMPTPPSGWHDVREQPGQGLQATDETGQAWRLGSARWVGGVAGEAAAERDDSLCIYFGPAGSACVRLDFEEALRPGAAPAVQSLMDDRVALALVSGDGAARVQSLAQRLHIEQAVSAASPEAKLSALRDAQARGHAVAMVGDGINDAPVLAQADVSFAMAAGAAIAQVQADGVIVSNELQALVDARRLAQRTVRVIRQNLAWAFAYNLACVPLALIGWLPPWAAGLGMATSSLVVVGNSLRLARPSRPSR